MYSNYALRINKKIYKHLFPICVYNRICVIGEKNMYVLDFFICYEKCLLMSVFNMNVVLRRFS